MKRIIRITNKGIEYEDRGKQIKFIDFEECNTNWKDYHRDKENITEKYISETVCVGERNWLQFSFYTNPKTEIKFKRSFWCINPKKAYFDLYHKIIEMGWSTYDMS